MEILHAPWRTGHVKKETKTKDEFATSHECVFCELIRQTNDEENFILRRYQHTIVMMNRYPYNTGHLLVLPIAHKDRLFSLTPEELHEYMDVITHCTKVANDVLKAQGVNVGMNIGKIAGASIPSHIHMHVLPRWERDTNFLPLICDTKALSTDMREIYTELKPHFE